jgi:uncharacterized protein (TIGR03437 family)
MRKLRIAKQLLKLTLAGLCGLGSCVFYGLGQRVSANVTGPPSSRTGAPALGVLGVEPTCTLCHSSFPLNGGPGVLMLSGLPPTYQPGEEITVTVTLTQAGQGRFGFEAQVLDDLGRRAGEFLVTDTLRTRLVEGTGGFAGRQYIQHLLPGVAPSVPNQGSWSFVWKAPQQSQGRVIFYVAGNAANNNGGTGGDYIYTVSQSVQPAGNLLLGSAASLTASGTTAADSIMTMFGAGLANETEVANALPLPTTLAGTTVRVRDATGGERNAPLFFVSPNQINFIMPTGTRAGVATVAVIRENNTVGSATLTVENVAPALFTANANGQGLPTAVVLRIRAGGAQVFEPVVQFNAVEGRFEAVPIELGAATDQVLLVLFGSGLRGRSDVDNRALIGGVDARVQFVGAQGGLAGLDQANLWLPRALAGAGEVNLALTLDGRRTNLVTINIK